VILSFVLGFGFGFIGSIPVAGPISALVFSRGLAGRFRSGAFIALGGAVAEAAYAFLAFWGFSAFLTRYAFIVPVSRALGALILTALGISFLRMKSLAQAAGDGHADTAWASFVLGLTITALNPTLIATWTAVVTTLYSTELLNFSTGKAYPFGAGTLSGIALWFLALLGLIRAYKDRFTVRTLLVVVRAVGVMLLGTAGWFVYRFAQYLLGVPS
jgi:threonine/homoserine/homoserine lactone efflux protein